MVAGLDPYWILVAVRDLYWLLLAGFDHNWIFLAGLALFGSIRHRWIEVAEESAVSGSEKDAVEVECLAERLMCTRKEVIVEKGDWGLLYALHPILPCEFEPLGPPPETEGGFL